LRAHRGLTTKFKYPNIFEAVFPEVFATSGGFAARARSRARIAASAYEGTQN
jgi:hypothetical protein